MTHITATVVIVLVGQGINLCISRLVLRISRIQGGL